MTWHLNTNERDAIDSDPWFSSLSAELRHDILRYACVRRYRDGEPISARGEMARAWSAVAKGAVRVGTTTATGRQLTFMYVDPGSWFGIMAMFDGGRLAQDAFAHGETTLLRVACEDVHRILSEHVELYPALLRLQARRRRWMFNAIEDLSTLPLRARVAKKLLHLVRSYGVPSAGREVRIGLRLAQNELAELLGASRQRVNEVLSAMRREKAIRIEAPGVVIVRNREALLRLSDTDD
ncbi:Crp/Fnr family transcriptional regulator [Caenimonas soli]|uniref:Crp/Fnr family transcriptional regulator n=1 Tax=Caenimonas soli TaxID=2735555 RepID=UPI001552A202|nr:Crp/Fnr family transcriptional regulator [Caenimonas soli]NPC57771.1 Crp/Fnr family transcriptional regulator [Caenimonas soli]